MDGIEVKDLSADEAEAFFESLQKKQDLEADRQAFLGDVMDLARFMAQHAQSRDDLNRFYSAAIKAVESSARAQALQDAALLVKDMPRRAAVLTLTAAQDMANSASHLGEALVASARTVAQSSLDSAKAVWNTLAQAATSMFSKAVFLFKRVAGLDEAFNARMDAKINAGIDAVTVAAKSIKNEVVIHAGAVADLATQASLRSMDSLKEAVSEHVVRPVAETAGHVMDAAVRKKEETSRYARVTAQAALQSAALRAQNIADAADLSFRLARQTVVRHVESASNVVASGMLAVSQSMASAGGAYRQAVEQRRSASVAAGMRAIEVSMPGMAAVNVQAPVADMMASAARIEPAFDVALSQGASSAQEADRLAEADLDGLFSGYKARAVASIMAEVNHPTLEKAEEIAEDLAEDAFAPRPIM